MERISTIKRDLNGLEWIGTAQMETDQNRLERKGMDWNGLERMEGMESDRNGSDRNGWDRNGSEENGSERIGRISHSTVRFEI